jgi:hypothetical protein
MEVDIFEYLSRNTLHDKVVESISSVKLSDVVSTMTCTCRFWDSNANSLKRIYLTFENPKVEGDFDIGFDIFDALVDMYGDDVRITLYDSTSGLDTVIYCATAVVCFTTS